MPPEPSDYRALAAVRIPKSASIPARTQRVWRGVARQPTERARRCATKVSRDTPCLLDGFARPWTCERVQQLNAILPLRIVTNDTRGHAEVHQARHRPPEPVKVHHEQPVYEALPTISLIRARGSGPAL